MTRERAHGRGALSALAALALLLAACAADPEPTTADETPWAEDGWAPTPTPLTTPEEEASEVSAPPTPPAREEPAPSPRPDADDDPVPELLDFTAPGVDGGQVVGAEYAGQAVALWFWAPW